ncbi:MAG TPA: PQQ-dependent sugar dehydrogenase [Casimicrobiaceae bacterium]|nr:PQQ-dependent sugar dehydrogenase [Casimicrobiaceae bacterium]
MKIARKFLAAGARIATVASLAALASPGTSGAVAQSALPLDSIKLPPGFAIELVARVPNARAMTWGAAGTLFVGSYSEGKVYAITLPASGSKSEPRVQVIASGLRAPGGVAFRERALYVSALSQIVRFDDIEARLATPPKPAVVNDRLPAETHHGLKYIAFGPDGKLYVNVGVPCNICEPEGDRYGVILRMNPDGSGSEVFVRGLRNSVGFDWDPRTKELWFTDNGRDNLGDDVPPDTLNHAARAGLRFGYPYCHGGTIADPEFGRKHPCSEFVAPAQNLGPHVASLGMRFYTGNQFPAAYRNRIFIAEHGSWNRSRKIGYRVTMVTLDGNKGARYEPFAEGWLQGESAWGRPADVLVAPDGSLLVSDDSAGAIYRIRYKDQ